MNDFLNLAAIFKHNNGKNITYEINGTSFRDIMLKYADSNQDGVITAGDDGENQSESSAAYDALRRLDIFDENKKRYKEIAIEYIHHKNTFVRPEEHDDLISIEEVKIAIRAQNALTIQKYAQIQADLNTNGKCMSLDEFEYNMDKLKLSIPDINTLSTFNALQIHH